IRVPFTVAVTRPLVGVMVIGWSGPGILMGLLFTIVSPGYSVESAVIRRMLPRGTQRVLEQLARGLELVTALREQSQRCAQIGDDRRKQCIEVDRCEDLAGCARVEVDPSDAHHDEIDARFAQSSECERETANGPRHAGRCGPPARRSGAATAHSA